MENNNPYVRMYVICKYCTRYLSDKYYNIKLNKWKCPDCNYKDVNIIPAIKIESEGVI